MANTSALKDAKDALTKKSEETEGFVADSIAKIRATMTANSDKTYGPPSIPDTPSRAINDMLNTRCGKTFSKAPKYYVAVFICLIFTAITKVYKLIYKHSETKGPSHTMWMAACGIIAAEHLIASIILYYIVVALTFLLHHFLYYGFAVFCLFGVGLAVAGMVFFDKDKSKKQSPGFEPATPNKAD